MRSASRRNSTPLWCVAFSCAFFALTSTAWARTNAQKSVFADKKIAETCANKFSAAGDDLKNCVYAKRIWTKYQLASVVSGIDDNGRVSGRRIFVAFVGSSPYLLKAGRSAVERQQRAIAESIGSDLRVHLDLNIVSAPDRLDQALKKTPGSSLDQAANSVSAEVAKEVANVLQLASLDYSTQMTTIFRKYGVQATDFGLALIEVACRPSLNCRAGDYAFEERSNGFQRYGKLRDWAFQQKAIESRMPYRLQLGASNALLMQPDPTILPIPGDAYPLEPSAERRMSEFERLVARVRSNRASSVTRDRSLIEINFAAAQAAQLPKRSLLAVADVIDAPGYANLRLGTAGEGLKSTSDELARTRIRECLRLRGEVTPQGVSDCSGYQVDAQTLVDCMNRGRCIPATGKKMVADLLLIAEADNLQSLSQLNAFPRIEIGSAKQYTDIAQKCHETDGSTASSLARCIVTSKDPKQKSMADCVDTARGAASKVDQKRLEPCILQAARAAGASSAAQTAMTCAMQHPSNPRGLAACSAGIGLSPEARTALNCIARVQNSSGKPSAELLFSCTGNRNTRLLQCASKKDYGEAALCAADGKIPEDIRQLMSCAADKASSPAAIAVCMGGKSVPGDAGRLLRCAADASFDGVGTALCMASDKLTADQRIFLQCAITSGGEPTSTATCTVGQLAMKEFRNCRGKKFGEYPCFGENNELIKLSARLGVPIGKNSVVADIANVQLRILEVPMAVIGDPAVEQLTKSSSAIVEAHMGVLEAISQIPSSPEGAVRKYAKSACTMATYGLVKC
ncbi:hypothetical protein [Neorhizobium sp. SHOUNA12B]|uniref:hypothetical protein n=1 Tax=Neorhizobium sp. SHOUNA12B TaxID=2908928 RepID=UPI0025CE3CC9|nr:hypothetical protein [Neorhizobium sp. SHOUNA12B]MCJ9672773.1 hypothetical protein [Neorhizobium sp. SHOUNA12B]